MPFLQIDSENFFNAHSFSCYENQEARFYYFQEMIALLFCLLPFFLGLSHQVLFIGTMFIGMFIDMRFS